MTNEKVAYPMLSAGAWHNLRVQFKKTIPATITKTYLASFLKITPESARTNIYAPLKLLGFIDENDKANNELIVRFRDDAKYPEFCQEIIQKVYPQELQDAFPDSDSEVVHIRSWFMNTNGLGENAASRCANFYKLLKEANPNNETKPKNGNSPVKEKKNIKSKPVKSKINQTEDIPVLETNNETTSEDLTSITRNLGGKNGITLNINIQLSVPETTDEIVYNKFFEALKKHLLT